MERAYYRYWGKANNRKEQTGDAYHLLPYHCLDVAAVGYLLMAPEKQLTKALAEYLELSCESLRSLLVFALALHDFGKFASAFQGLYSHESSELIRPNSRFSYNGKDYRHDTLGGYFWFKLRQENRFSLPCLENVDARSKKKIFKSLNVLMECVLGHHGKPINSYKHLIEMEPYTEPGNLDAADEFVQALILLFEPEIPIELFADKQWRKRLEQVSWHLAGLAVLADWIGSDSEKFPYKAEPQMMVDYWHDSLEKAKNALDATDIAKPIKIKPFLSIEKHFGFSPTPLQNWAESVKIDDSPQLFILEDVTGSGKTEAALALTHRLMQAGAADGFYFGLPTMATSNAMFSRVANGYLQMMSSDTGAPSIVLAHGSRDMNERFQDAVLPWGREEKNYAREDPTATAQCARWLADSRKKALLAPVGVGTIDQPLLAVLPRRHQSLRLLGLHRKVLIFDEVHAADEYMLELLESLLALHLHQGGSVILLTATLSLQQRKKLCAIWQIAGNVPVVAPHCRKFPLATKVSLSEEGLHEEPLESRSDVSRKVTVRFLHKFDDCVDTVLGAVAQGQCVVWVRNSVDDAIEGFKRVRERMDNPEHCILFHSRFILQERKELEYRVLDIFGKDQQNGEKRKGRVLIATQVFQESLDADADLMISDLCPIDDLIQRAGRLHRHTRDENGVYQEEVTDTRNPPELFLHAPALIENPDSDWLSRDFPNTQFVYRSAGRLWLGMQKLKELGAIRMPEDARELIEAVYSEDALVQIPEKLIKQENTYFGEQRSKAAKARFQLLKWDREGYCIKSTTSENDWAEDESEISTRYSDIETVEVLLVKEAANGELVPWTGTSRFAVELSTVKVGKNKYADKLSPLPQHLERAEKKLKERFIRARYLQCWLPDRDPNFAYDPTLGFYERNPH